MQNFKDISTTSQVLSSCQNKWVSNGINWYDKTILGGLLLFVFVLPFGFHTATLISMGLLLPLITWITKILLKKKIEFNPTPLFLPILLWGVIVILLFCWVFLQR